MNPAFSEQFYTDFQPTSWTKCNPDDDVQSFTEFVESHQRGFKRSFPNGNKIHIVLVCFDSGINDELMKNIADFVSIWFDLSTTWIREEYNFTESKQVSVEPLNTYLQEMKNNKSHRNTFCVLGITSKDLTAEGMNFIYGVALPSAKVGVVSFKRYMQKNNIIFKDALSVVVHEIGHLIDLTHCTTYKCVMNGSNNMQDFRSHPLSLCPICTQKFSYAMSEIGVNFEDRFRKLAAFYKLHDMKREFDWIQNKINEYTLPPHYDGEKSSCGFRVSRAEYQLAQLLSI